MTMVTPEMVDGWVRGLADRASDPEGAHCEEDEIRERVLKAIAEGRAENPRECARRALETELVDFPRWYA